VAPAYQPAIGSDRGDLGARVTPNGGNEYRLPVAGTYHPKSRFLQDLPLR